MNVIQFAVLSFDPGLIYLYQISVSTPMPVALCMEYYIYIGEGMVPQLPFAGNSIYNGRELVQFSTNCSIGCWLREKYFVYSTMSITNLCDYFVSIHGHHKIRGIRDASALINLRSPKFIGSSFTIRDKVTLQVTTLQHIFNRHLQRANYSGNHVKT